METSRGDAAARVDIPWRRVARVSEPPRRAVRRRSTIGFVGTALVEAAASAGPVARALSGGCVEFWIQGLGAALTQGASWRGGFFVCAGAQAAATALAAVALYCLPRPDD